METKDLRTLLESLKKSATKDQKKLIDLILKMIDGKAKKAPNKTLARLLKIDDNKPIVYQVLELLCRFGITVAEHEIISEVLKLIKLYL